MKQDPRQVCVRLIRYRTPTAFDVRRQRSNNNAGRECAPNKGPGQKQSDDSPPHSHCVPLPLNPTKAQTHLLFLKVVLKVGSGHSPLPPSKKQCLDLLRAGSAPPDHEATKCSAVQHLQRPVHWRSTGCRSSCARTVNGVRTPCWRRR